MPDRNRPPQSPPGRPASGLSRRDFNRGLLPLLAAPAALLAAPAAAQSLPPRAQLDRFGLERAWASRATLDVARDVVRHVVADEDVVIVQSRSGMMTVFDAQTGIKLWDGVLARGDQYSYPAVTNADVLMVVIGSTVYARDKFRGNPLWELRLPNVPSTSPEVDDERMYVGMLEGSCYAFNLDRIRSLQTEGRLGQFAYQTIEWRFRTSGEIRTRPVSNGTVVSFASATGTLYAVTANRRGLVFQFETSARPSAPLTLADGHVYFAASDQNFYCLRTSNGTTRWEFVTGRPVEEKPAVIGENVFLSPVRGGLYNLSTVSGRQYWWSPTAEKFLAVSPTRVYATDATGALAVLDRASGAVLGVMPLSEYPVRVQNERTDRIYLSTPNGLVVCLREQGAEIPIYHRFPERRPILPEFFDENAPVEEAAPTDLPAE